MNFFKKSSPKLKENQMSIEAMKQALEALERLTKTLDHGFTVQPNGNSHENGNYAITALRTAIKQAEKQDGDCQQCGGQGCVACDARKQEPVAWRWKWGNSGWQLEDKRPHNADSTDATVEPLYTHPAPTVPVQKPVAWVNHGENRITRVTGWDGYGALYTTPQPQEFVCSTGLCHYTQPQREWVGLTDEEIDKTEWVPLPKTQITLDIGWIDNMKVFARAIEAKLKEKNGWTS